MRHYKNNKSDKAEINSDKSILRVPIAVEHRVLPANRLNSVSEYYFSAKLREIAEMNAGGKNVLNLGIGNVFGTALVQHMKHNRHHKLGFRCYGSTGFMPR